MFVWWTGARYERDGEVMIVRRARVLAAFWILGIALALLILGTRSFGQEGSTGGWAMGSVWLLVSVVGLLWWRIPPVVADANGIHLRRLLRRSVMHWEDVVGFEMNLEYGHWDLWPRLRLRLGNGRSLGVAGGSLTLLVPSQVAELRDLGRQLAHHAEVLGKGRRPWPERTRFEEGAPWGSSM